MGVVGREIGKVAVVAKEQKRKESSNGIVDAEKARWHVTKQTVGKFLKTLPNYIINLSLNFLFFNYFFVNF